MSALTVKLTRISQADGRIYDFSKKQQKKKTPNHQSPKKPPRKSSTKSISNKYLLKQVPLFSS